MEPKLHQVGDDLIRLRQKGRSRSSAEEKEFEQLQGYELELQAFRDEILRLAQRPWQPNLNDGAQITAAPLFQLFQFPKWKKSIRDTWLNLEKGHYDWTHLAMAYWPDRVREKCRTDKSLAIAHDLGDLYEPPPEKAGAGRRGRKHMAEPS